MLPTMREITLSLKILFEQATYKSTVDLTKQEGDWKGLQIIAIKLRPLRQM